MIVSKANILIIGIVAFALIFRLTLVLTHDPMLGVDGGAYLLSRNTVLGDEPTGVGFPRPPLAPGWLLVPFTEVFGDDKGFKIWTALASLLPLLPVYLLARDISGKSAGIFALAFMAVDLTQMEMMVTGALPQVGFALIGLSVWALLRLSEGWSRKHAWVLALSLGLIPYINHTSAGIAVVVLPIVFGYLAWKVKRNETFQYLYWRGYLKQLGRMVGAAAIGAIIGLGALPWYTRVFPVTGELNYPGPFLWMVHPVDFAVEQAIIGWSVVIMVAVTKAPYKVKALAVMVGILSTMLLFLSSDETIINLLYRPRYLLALPLYACIAWLVFNKGNVDTKSGVFFGMAATVWIALVFGQAWIFDRQTTYSDMILPETAEILESIKGDDRAVITNSYTLSHWVAALNKVKSPNTFAWRLGPSPYYQESDRNVRCLLGWVPGCDPVKAKKALNAGYILIDQRFPYYSNRASNVYGAISEDTWGNLPDVPWLHLQKEIPPIQLWAVK